MVHWFKTFSGYLVRDCYGGQESCHFVFNASVSFLGPCRWIQDIHSLVVALVKSNYFALVHLCFQIMLTVQKAMETSKLMVCWQTHFIIFQIGIDSQHHVWWTNILHDPKPTIARPGDALYAILFGNNNFILPKLSKSWQKVAWSRSWLVSQRDLVAKFLSLSRCKRGKTVVGLERE